MSFTEMLFEASGMTTIYSRTSFDILPPFSGPISRCVLQQKVLTTHLSLTLGMSVGKEALETGTKAGFPGGVQLWVSFV